MKNWAGNVTFGTGRHVAPGSLDELSALVANSRRIKVQGSRHSFNTIADSSETLVSLENFGEIGEPDPESRSVRIGGGVTYGQLAIHLQSRGWALSNLASLPHISVIGACATATHGSGRFNKNLSNDLLILDVMGPGGEVRNLAAGSAEAKLVAIGLGAVGIITNATVRIEPTYLVRQWVYEQLPFEVLISHFDVLSRHGYSLSLFTKWTSDFVDQMWVKERQDGLFEGRDECFGAKLATEKLHPLREMDPINCTDQLGVAGPWSERLAHFKLEFTPSAGEELQSEYFVNFEHATAAVDALRALGSELDPLLFVSEIRFIAKDDLPMSPAFGADIVAFHFTWRPLWEQVREVLPKIEALLAPLGARPHFGKLFTMQSDRLAEVYPRLSSLRNYAAELDPEGKFLNEFLTRSVFGIKSPA
ncbi:MAG: FAD-binding protein [Fimbriimonas sp.]|nr:FAD-binding protein [Fimbriimonas sp.]